MAATVVLGLSPLGFVQVPGLGEAITFLHIPMILAATLEGPLAAGVVGLVFGVIAGYRFPIQPMPFHIVGRVLAGLLAGLTFKTISDTADEGSRVTRASVATAVIGTGANTFFMCLFALHLGLSTPAALLSLALIHGAIEIVSALVVTTPVTLALTRSQP